MSKPIVYLERSESEPLMEHVLAAWQGFKWNGYEIRWFYPLIEEDSFVTGPRGSMWMPDHLVPPLKKTVPVVGSTESIRRFFAHYGWPLPAPLNIPEALLGFTERTISTSTIGEFITTRQNHPMFVKPLDQVKLWTGDVVRNNQHLEFLWKEGDQWKYSMDTRIQVADEVNFESEYRLFVNRQGTIDGMRHYKGDPWQTPDKTTTRMMLNAYYPNQPCSYALDVGVLGNGKTAIVECNDFWALGTYGFDPVRYAELTAQRWHQLLTS